MARKTALAEVSSTGVALATRASAVYEQLRSDIAHGVLEPGSKLRVEAMCDRYGVGASPLREAMNRLSAEGLVERNDLRGFSVAPLHWDELPILSQNRIQLESIALRESIERRDAPMEDQLVLLVHRLSRTPRSLSAELCDQPRLGNPAPRVPQDLAVALRLALAARFLRQPGRRVLPLPAVGRWQSLQQAR
jgi:DNA-binding transcriptional MocR family regulator